MIRLAVVLIALSLSATGNAQTSLKELAREHGGYASNVIDQEPPLLTVEQMVVHADLIIRGHIIQATPRLSDDESLVFTEYTIAPAEVIKGSAEPSTAARPGLMAPVTVRQVGGAMTVDGLRLRTETNYDEAGSPLVLRGEYVFFLAKALESSLGKVAKPNSYEFVAGPYAALKIQNAKIVHVTKEAARRQGLSTGDAETFLAEVRSLARRPAK
jgi:hypothetical protein